MKVIALETFSTGVISMFKGEIRDIADDDTYYSDYQTLLTEGEYISEYSEGGGSGGMFIVDITEIYDETTSETTFSASKTYAEIDEALTNGNTICARFISSTYKPIMYLTAQSEDEYGHHRFEFYMTEFVGDATDGYFINGYHVRITSDNVVTYEYAEKAFYE